MINWNNIDYLIVQICLADLDLEIILQQIKTDK